jgi:hypothetical protein
MLNCRPGGYFVLSVCEVMQDVLFTYFLYKSLHNNTCISSVFVEIGQMTFYFSRFAFGLVG